MTSEENLRERHNNTEHTHKIWLKRLWNLSVPFPAWIVIWAEGSPACVTHRKSLVLLAWIKRNRLNMKWTQCKSSKWNWNSITQCESRSVVSDSLQPHGIILSMEFFSRPEYWSGELLLSPGDLPSPETEPRSPALQADSSPAEPQGKSKNTGVGSLSLLIPIQESNRGLLHCRRILYQLSYQGRTMTVFSETVSFLRPGAKSSTYMPLQP